MKKFHETSDFDTKEIYPYRIEGLGKNLIPTATNFEVIDVFEKVTDEDAAHTARELGYGGGSFYRLYKWGGGSGNEAVCRTRIILTRIVLSL